jgi:hypothetical protein
VRNKKLLERVLLRAIFITLLTTPRAWPEDGLELASPSRAVGPPALEYRRSAVHGMPHLVPFAFVLFAAPAWRHSCSQRRSTAGPGLWS